MKLTPKPKAMLEKLAKGRRMLPAQIVDVRAAKKLLAAGYTKFEDDVSVKDWSRGGSPAQVLVITDAGRDALAQSK